MIIFIYFWVHYMYIMLFWVCTDFCVYDFWARPNRRGGGGFGHKETCPEPDQFSFLTDSSTCKPGWPCDHLNLQKIAYIHLPKKIIHRQIIPSPCRRQAKFDGFFCVLLVGFSNLLILFMGLQFLGFVRFFVQLGLLDLSICLDGKKML